MSYFEITASPITVEVQKGVFEATQANLYSRGSLLEGQPTLDQIDRGLIGEKLGVNAAEKIVNLSPELLEVDPEKIMYAGGVCALSTRESRLLGLEVATEDAATGAKLALRDADDLEQLQDVVSAVQIFETVGLVPYPTTIVLEDDLWSERVAGFLRFAGKDEAALAATGLVKSRNRKTEASVDGLRTYLFGPGVDPVEPVIDGSVLETLTEGTDRMLKEMGLEDITTPYRRVFAGMYSYVWRDVLKQAGIITDDQVMAVYEPSKHIGREDGVFQDISRFKAAAVRQFPLMQPGSPADKLGLIAYMEPRDPNGKRFRDAIPLALMPNSINYRGFDFGRFPIVPKKKDDQLAELAEFTFLDDMDSMTLMKNPVFLWGLMYPTNTETARLLGEMRLLSEGYKNTTRRELNLIEDFKERRQAADRIRAGYSDEMREFGESLVVELEAMNRAMFGGENESQ